MNIPYCKLIQPGKTELHVAISRLRRHSTPLSPVVASISALPPPRLFVPPDLTPWPPRDVEPPCAFIELLIEFMICWLPLGVTLVLALPARLRFFLFFARVAATSLILLFFTSSGGISFSSRLFIFRLFDSTGNLYPVCTRLHVTSQRTPIVRMRQITFLSYIIHVW